MIVSCSRICSSSVPSHALLIIVGDTLNYLEFSEILARGYYRAKTNMITLVLLWIIFYADSVDSMI